MFFADFELPGWVAGYPWSRPWVLGAVNLAPSCPVLLSNVVRSWMAGRLPAGTSTQLLLPDIVRSWMGWLGCAKRIEYTLQRLYCE